MFNSSPTLKLLILLLLLATTLYGQVTDATLKGVVTDENSNTVIASIVAAKNESTGQVRSTTTGDSGEFSLSGLPAGLYTIYMQVPGFKTYEQKSLKLSVGQMTELNIKLIVGDVKEVVEITSKEGKGAISTEGRISDTFVKAEITELPLSQRDIFLLPKLNAGATAIPGAASSTKLTNSPVITVNGNRYRGNNFVLDGAMNTNPNNTGEPAIVPSLESIEEMQVQTLNFSSEFGRGNGAVINLQTKSGSNQLRGRLWTYHRNASLNARNFFAKERDPQVFNQFGFNLGGPIIKDKTFFFGSYEGTRHVTGQSVTFLVESPAFRERILRDTPNSVTARLLRDFPATAPAPETIKNDIGAATATIDDFLRFNQYMVRIDHSFNNGMDKITGRWISEYQRDNGGTSSSLATLGRAMRGSRGPFNGFFGNLNLGHTHIFKRAINDLRVSSQFTYTSRGDEDAIVPTITITGITAPFGDVFKESSRLRTFEFRDTLTLDRGKHSIRLGGELRRIFKGLAIGPPAAGTYAFNNLSDFGANRPFRQTLTINPFTGEPTNNPRYFRLYESGLFIQDEWKVNSRLNLTLGIRHDYFGTVKERDGRLSSLILGEGSSFREQLANAAVGHVGRLYKPEKLNLSPRVGLAYDLLGDGNTVIRAGFSLAYQPHHGQSISGARALPPDAVQGVIQPGSFGTNIIYDIPVPFNPQFARGLNEKGGIKLGPNDRRAIRPTGFVVNPTIKTQYTQSWFLNVQQKFFKDWVGEIGYTGTRGINLERIDDINRYNGDLLEEFRNNPQLLADARDGAVLSTVENRINPNFGVLLFVTNGVTSDYHAMTTELRRNFSQGLLLQVNYRWSKWMDTSSDTSTGQFRDNAEPGKGAMNIDCLGCERARSLFDIPHRFSTSIMWVPGFFKGGNGFINKLGRDWQISAILTAQSGRPFSVWDGRPSRLVKRNGTIVNEGGDYNLDGGGGAVGGGFYDRPNIPAPGIVKSSFSKSDFLNGLFSSSIFPKPALGANGNLGRNTFRGPKYVTVDLALARSFTVWGEKQLQIRFEAFNAFNNVNLYLPNTDLANESIFGKSTQAFEPRSIQASMRFSF